MLMPQQPSSSAYRAQDQYPILWKAGKNLSCSAPKKAQEAQRGISLPLPCQAPTAARSGSAPGLGGNAWHCLRPTFPEPPGRCCAPLAKFNSSKNRGNHHFSWATSILEWPHCTLPAAFCCAAVQHPHNTLVYPIFGFIEAWRGWSPSENTKSWVVI